jgi:antitoxin (DNA-binding transcriptional repressor) of toxin-antitoxin stability system
MEKHISATQAVRDFSEVLNTIKFKGTHYVIERSGKPIAAMKPIDKDANQATLTELKRILKMLPGLDEELDYFAADLADIRKVQPLLPTGEIWE